MSTISLGTPPGNEASHRPVTLVAGSVVSPPDILDRPSARFTRITFWISAAILLVTLGSLALADSRQDRRRLHPPPAQTIWTQASARIQGSSLLVSLHVPGPGLLELTLLGPAKGIIAGPTRLKVAAGKQTVTSTLPLPRSLSNADLDRLLVRFHRAGHPKQVKTLILPMSSLLDVPMVSLDGQASLVIGSLNAPRILVKDPSGRPISGARVQVRITTRRQERLQAETRTDQAGLARAALAIPRIWRPGSARFTVTATSPSGLRRRHSFKMRILARAQVLLDLDKPVYQPGQTMHFRVLALSEPSRLPMNRARVLLTVQDSRSNLLFQKNLRTDAFGVAAAAMPLASGILTGRYTVQATIQDSDLDGKAPSMKKEVRVFEYRPPILAVSAEADRRFYAPGRKARIQVQAHHMWGSKVQSGRVVVTSMMTCKKGSQAIKTFGRREFRGNFNGQGLYQIEVPVPKLPRRCSSPGTRANLSLSIHVTAPGGFSAKKKLLLPVSNKEILLSILPQAGRLVPGLVQKLYVLAVTPDGRPARANLSLQVRGALLIGPGRRMAPSERIRVQTDADGTAGLDILVPEKTSHPIRLSVTARDRQGHSGSTRTALPVWKTRRLLVTTNCSLCKAGERVRIHVRGPKSLKGNLFLDLGGWNQTTQTLSARMQAGRAAVWTRMPASQAGLFRIRATVRPGAGNQESVGESLLFLKPGNRLQVHIAWNRHRYSPGGRAALAVSVTDEAGRPRKAALGLAVIDKAIYAMTGTRPQSGLGRFLVDDAAGRRDMNLRSLTPEAILSLPAKRGHQPLAAAFASLLLAKGYKAFTTRRHRTFAQEHAWYQSSLKRRLTRALKPWARKLGRSLSRATKRFWLKYHQHHPQLCDGAIPRLPKLSTLVMQGFLPLKKTRDPWGTPIRLSNETEDSCGSTSVFFSIQLAGPDRLFDTKDDLTFGPFRISTNGLPRNKHCAVGCMGMGAYGAGGAGARGAGVLNVIMGHAGFGSSFGDSPAMTTRKRMAETLVWRPMLRTDKQGKALVPFRLADNITTWVARVTASDDSGRLGFATASAPSAKPLFVDINLPRRLTRGDRINLPVVLFNETSSPLPVTVSLSPSAWYMARHASRRITVAAHASRPVIFPITVRGLGPQRITAQARSSNLGDSLVRSTLVEPRGRPVRLASTGTLSKDIEREIFIPPAAIQGTKTLSVTVEPGMTSIMRQSLSSLLRHPYGCFEQNASVTYPNILVLRLLGRYKDVLWRKAHAFVQAGYQRMLSYEVSTGGFSLFGHKPASIFLTALGLQMLADMEGLIAVDSAVIRRNIAYLAKRQDSDGSFDSLSLTAYAAWAMARHGHLAGFSVSSALAYLQKNRRRLLAEGPYSVALAAHALAAAGRLSSRFGRQLLASLEKASQAGRPGTRFWRIRSGIRALASRTAQTSPPRGGEGIFTLSGALGRSGRIEVTSLAAAVLQQRSNRQRLVREAMEFLLHNRDAQGSWYSTQATTLALAALNSARGLLGQNRRGSLLVRLDGKPAGRITLSDLRHGHAGSGIPVTAGLTLDDRLLTAGRHILSIRPQGGFRAFYRIGLTYRVSQNFASKRNRQTPASVLAEASLPPGQAGPGSGLRHRTGSGRSDRHRNPPSLENLEAKARANPEGPILSATIKYRGPSGMSTLKVHQPVKLQLYVENTSKFLSKSPMVEMRLAPGMVPVRADLDRYVKRWELRRYEITSGKLVFYLGRLRPGDLLGVDFRLVPTLAGRFSTGLSQVYDYYYPEGISFVPSTTVTVK